MKGSSLRQENSFNVSLYVQFSVWWCYWHHS